MDSDDEMVEEAVEGTSISVGPWEEAPEGARDAEGVAGCDRRGSGPPAAATVPYAGGRVRAGAGRPRPRHWERAGSGRAQAGNGAHPINENVRRLPAPHPAEFFFQKEKKKKKGRF